MKKGVQDDAGMKVTEMVDVMVTEMITRIQKAGIAVTSDGLMMVIAKSLEDENEAEGVGRGGADKGDSEGEGAAQWDKNDYLLAEPRLVEAPQLRLQHSRAVHRSGSFPNGAPYSRYWAVLGRRQSEQGQGSGAQRERDPRTRERGWTWT